MIAILIPIQFLNMNLGCEQDADCICFQINLILKTVFF